MFESILNARRAGALRLIAALVSGASLAAFVALAAHGGAAQEETAPDAWELSEPKPVDDGVPASVSDWESMSCARCHATIAREWAGSRHALAWIDPHYQAEIAKLRRPERCHGCHIPEPLHAGDFGQEPRARERRQHHGIDCRACHDGPDGAVLGPWGADTYAHVSVRSESFTEEGASRLCIACHATHIGPVIGIAKDFVATRQAERGKSCVGCHMAPVSRPTAADPDEDEPSPERAGRSHALQTPRDPAFLRQAFALSATRRGAETIVRVANRCGHRVPGLEGREIELIFTGLDAESGARVEERFVLSKQTYLPVEEPLEIRLALATERVLVRGFHRARGFAEPVEFLALELVPGE